MTTVADLIPGQVVDGPGLQSAIFVQTADHPIYPGLRLVVWKLFTESDDDTDDSWSHDALDPRQDVGTARPSTVAERSWWLRRALFHRSMWGPKP